MLKVFAESPLLTQKIREKVPKGKVILVHPDEKRSKELQNSPGPLLLFGRTDEDFLHVGMPEGPSAIVFVLTLGKFDVATALLTASRLLRTSGKQRAKVFIIGWTSAFKENSANAEIISLYVDPDELAQEAELAGGMEITRLKDHGDLYVCELTLPRIHFQDDWGGFTE